MGSPGDAVQPSQRQYVHLPSEDTDPGYWEGRGKGFTGLGDTMDTAGMDGLGDVASDWAALAKLTPAQQQALATPRPQGPTQITTEAYKMLTPVQAQFYWLCTANGHNDPYSETGCLAEAKRITGPALTPAQLGVAAKTIAALPGERGSLSGLVPIVAVGAIAGLGYLWWRRK